MTKYVFLSSLGIFDGLLVGDRGYPCAQHLMTPYPDPDTPPQSHFNVALGKCRVRIEMTFGVIKCRFNCLRGLRVRPERVCGIIIACVVLHNIAMMRKERTPHVPLVAADVVDPVTDHPTGAAIRQALTANYFSRKIKKLKSHSLNVLFFIAMSAFTVKEKTE